MTDAVALRFVVDGVVHGACPSWVVEDAPDRVVLQQPPGTSFARSTGPRGGPRGRNLVTWDGGWEILPWTGSGVVRAHLIGRSWSLWRWYSEDGWDPGLYLNLEAPWLRSEVGWDSADWHLDVDLDDDLTTWSWKDEDELAWSVEHGHLGPDIPDRARAAAADALATAARLEWPFVGLALPMRVDIPELPEGWQLT